MTPHCALCRREGERLWRPAVEVSQHGYRLDISEPSTARGHEENRWNRFHRWTLSSLLDSDPPVRSRSRKLRLSSCSFRILTCSWKSEGISEEWRRPPLISASPASRKVPLGKNLLPFLKLITALGSCFLGLWARKLGRRQETVAGSRSSRSRKRVNEVVSSFSCSSSVFSVELLWASAETEAQRDKASADATEVSRPDPLFSSERPGEREAGCC